MPHERAFDLLALHTKNGACALGLDTEIGTIESGKKADIVFINLSEFRMNSILSDDNAEQILEVVLQEASSQQVSDVMINGEFYVREGHVLTYSEEDLAREGQAIFKKFLSFSEQKETYPSSPATILQFSAQQKSESKSSLMIQLLKKDSKSFRRDEQYLRHKLMALIQKKQRVNFQIMLRKYLEMMKYNSDYKKENQVKTLNLILIAILLLIVTIETAIAQSYAGDGATVEPTMLIDKPTAGLLKRGAYSITSNFYQEGGVLLGISVGMFDPFMFGISYGGTNIIGPNKIEMNPMPGINAKLRIVSESSVMPALAIGFDSQGKEPYVDSLSRYTIKSPGVYIAASKNYEFLGNLSVHGGLNKSMETNDGDKDLDMYVGAEKSIGRDISIMLEYDFAENDNNNHAIGKGNGYLNFGFRWTWGKGLVVGFNLKNITKNQNNVDVANRTLQIDYIGNF